MKRSAYTWTRLQVRILEIYMYVNMDKGTDLEEPMADCFHRKVGSKNKLNPEHKEF